MSNLQFPPGLAERLVRVAPEKFRYEADPQDLRFWECNGWNILSIRGEAFYLEMLRSAGAWALDQLPEDTDSEYDGPNGYMTPRRKSHVAQDERTLHPNRWISALLALCEFREGLGK